MHPPFAETKIFTWWYFPDFTGQLPASHQGCCYDRIDTIAVTNIFPLAFLCFLLQRHDREPWNMTNINCLMFNSCSNPWYGFFFFFNVPGSIFVDFFQLSQWKNMKFTLYFTTFWLSLQLCWTAKWKYEVGGVTRLWWCKMKTHECPKSQCTAQYRVNFCLFYRVSWITQLYLKTAWGKISEIMYALPDYRSSLQNRDRSGNFLPVFPLTCMFLKQHLNVRVIKDNTCNCSLDI